MCRVSCLGSPEVRPYVSSCSFSSFLFALSSFFRLIWLSLFAAVGHVCSIAVALQPHSPLEWLAIFVFVDSFHLHVYELAKAHFVLFVA